MSTQPKTSSGRDVHVVERVLHGDAEVYRVLVDRYQADAMAHAFAMCGNAKAGETAVNSSFLDAFHALKDIPDRSQFRPFLFRALRRRLQSLASAAKPEPLEEGEIEQIRTFLDGLASADGPLFAKALLHQEPSRREVISLLYVARLPEEEAAYVAGNSAAVFYGEIDKAKREFLNPRTKEVSEEKDAAPLPLPMEDGVDHD